MRQRLFRRTLCLAGSVVLAGQACADGLRDNDGATALPPIAEDAGSLLDGAILVDAGALQPDANVEAGATQDPPEGPSVRFIGRFDTRTADEPRCAWPGCRIVARFEGTSVSVKLTEYVDDWMVGAPSEWDVAIDGVWQTKLVLVRGPQSLQLAEGLAQGPHEVELFKRSEAQTGVTGFGGFDFGADGVLLPPPPRNRRNIEVIGDSLLTGFGMNGAGPECPISNQAAAWQDFHESFGVLIGESLHADVRGTAYSGKGITKNIWRPDPWTMPRIFPLADPIDPSSAYDVHSYVPDVVIVGIGGLDFAIGQPVDDGPANLADFTTAYAAFMATLRDAYPNAQILCIVGPAADGDDTFIRDSVVAGVTGAIDLRKGAGDARISLFLPDHAPSNELTGCNGHGTPAFHQRLARELTPVVQKLAGW